MLYLHGWSDYFFQTELAQTWHGLGAAFYAVDLRKYGRSLRPHQTPGYADHLEEYDADIAAALDVVREDLGAHVAIMLMGHSTGGLVAALWAHRHPGVVRGLVLNSPWLELQGSSVARTVSGPAIRQLARFQPRAPLPNVDPGYYARTLRDREDGTWTIDDAWRPVPSFPVRAGWLRAIISAPARRARGAPAALAAARPPGCPPSPGPPRRPPAPPPGPLLRGVAVVGGVGGPERTRRSSILVRPSVRAAAVPGRAGPAASVAW